MKQLLSLSAFLILLISFSLNGCRRRTNAHFSYMIARADTLLSHDSASAAYEYLLRDSAKAAQADEKDAMPYMLTLYNAKDQAVIPLTDDSLMKRVENYYSRHGNTNEQTLARYLVAACYRDQDLYLESQQWANLAEEKADTLNKNFNYDLLYKVCALRAQTFAFKLSKDVYLEDFQRAAYYAKKAGDGLKVAEANCRVALTYFQMGKFEEAQALYERCIRDYTELGYGRTSYVSACILKLAEIEIARRNIVAADSLMAEFEHREGGHLKSDSYLLEKGLFSYLPHKSDLCILKKEYTKALAYSQRESRLGGNFTGWATEEMADIFGKMGMSDSAYHYLKQYIAFYDSLQESIKAVELQRSQHRFNAMQSEKKIQIANQRTSHLIFLSSLLFIGFIAVSATFFLHNQRHKALIQQMQKDYNQAKTQIETLKQLKKAQEETGYVTETNGPDLDTAIQESEKRMKYLHQKMPRLAENELLMQNIADDPTAKRIRRKAESGKNVTEEDLDSLNKSIGKIGSITNRVGNPFLAYQ